MEILSYTKANKLRKESRDIRNVKSRTEFSEALRCNAVPANDFWYTNSFTYDLWKNRRSGGKIVMSDYSYKSVYEAFNALLGGISSARSAHVWDGYVPDAMGN